MPDTPSITINKQFTYRGDSSEVFSNTYHFSGTTPTTDAGWKALADAIWAAESPMFPSNIFYRGFLGYQAGNEHAVSIRDNLEFGSLTPGGASFSSSGMASGDVAFWVRWATPDRTSRGKRIYLRKYFHGALVTSTDLLYSGQKDAATTYAAKMTDGSLPGGAKVCGPQGAVAGTAVVSKFVTTRSLKRRGKRPH